MSRLDGSGRCVKIVKVATLDLARSGKLGLPAIETVRSSLHPYLARGMWM